MNWYLGLSWQLLLRFGSLFSAKHRWLWCFLFFYWIHQLLCFRLFLSRLPKRIFLRPPLHIKVKKREIMFRQFCPRGWCRHDSNIFLARYFLFLFLFFAIVSIFLSHPQLLLSVFLLLEFPQLIEFFGIVLFLLRKRIKRADSWCRCLDTAIPVPLSMVLLWMTLLNFDHISSLWVK